MKNTERLSDFEHPAVRSMANELAAGKTSSLDKAEAIFNFVRDDIRFGFPATWDRVKASTTLESGIGYCTTKATLFHALCLAAGIPSRIHTGLIDINIMRGVLPSFAFAMLPPTGSHAWVDIQVDGDWKSLDSYINDQAFYEGALKRLRSSGRSTAFSISEANGPSSCEFNFGERGYVQMGAVLEDHGNWDDVAEYLASDKYRGPTGIRLALFPLLIPLCNRNIRKIRVQTG